MIDAEWPINKKILEMYEVKSPVPPLVLWFSFSLSVKSPYSLLPGIILHVRLCHIERWISQVTVERRNYATNEKWVTRTTWCLRPVAVVFGNGKVADRHREQSLKYIVYLIILKCTIEPSNLYTIWQFRLP